MLELTTYLIVDSEVQLSTPTTTNADKKQQARQCKHEKPEAF